MKDNIYFEMLIGFLVDISNYCAEMQTFRKEPDVKRSVTSGPRNQ